MERRRRHKRKSRKPIYAIVAIVIVFFCILTYSFLRPTSQTNISQDFSYKTAIVDHLSLTAPNPTFIQTATNMLEHAGYTVDYYPGEEVTVNFFRNLPKHDYDLVVLRVHSALMGGISPPVGLFTSESLSKTKYIYELLTDQLVGAKFTDQENEYFAFTPLFVKYSMNGRFENTKIIMMACDGLTYTGMAEAFTEKGAEVYVSWNGPVSASHTDYATNTLLRHLVTEKQTIEQAVTETMKEVGLDPEYESILQCYPNV